MKAIVIGAGSTIYDKNHLETLSNSNFDGYVLPCDRILKYAIHHGVTPQKFPRYYTCIINNLVEPSSRWHIMNEFFNSETIKLYAKNIKCFLSTQVHSKQREYLIDMGMTIAGYYNQNEKRNSGTFSDNCPLWEFDDCGHVCMALWNFAKYQLHCSKIALLGVDLSHSEHDTKFYNGSVPSWNNQLTRTLKLLEETKDVQTYNCTGGGRVYGNNIIGSTLKEFLVL
jgi:hypothetical protein